MRASGLEVRVAVLADTHLRDGSATQRRSQPVTTVGVLDLRDGVLVRSAIVPVA